MLKRILTDWQWRAGWLLWAGLALALAGKSLLVSPARSVYPLFAKGGEFWLRGLDTYTGECANFQYWPGFAAFMAPFSLLPEQLGALLWSALNLGLFVYAALLLAREFLPAGRKYTGLFLCACFPLAFEGLFNQQSNPLLIALSMLGAVMIARQRWWLGALLLLLPGLTKIAPLCFALLILTMFPRRLWWRYAICGLGLLALPFLLQAPGYVYAEYASWLATLRGEDGQRWAYRDAWIIWELLTQGYVTNHAAVEGTAIKVYRVVQLLAAGGAFLLCCWRRYVDVLSDRTATVFAFACGGWWLLTFGPSTEIATCVSVAPALAWGLLHSLHVRARRGLMVCAFTLTALGALGDVEFNLHRLTGSDWPKILLPLGGLLFGLWLLLLRDKSDTQEASTQ